MSQSRGGAVAAEGSARRSRAGSDSGPALQIGLSSAKRRMLRRIERRQARVGVFGAGYVGMAVALEAARVGFTVTCFDIDQERVRAVNEGRSYLDDVRDEALQQFRQAGRLEAKSEFSSLARTEVMIICVPTPLTPSKEPDLSAMRMSAAEVKRHLRPGRLVVLESTTYPGTTEEVLRPRLESTGLRAGKDFWLAFSPERIDPGNKRHTFRTTPKIVGGVDPDSTAVAGAFYETLVDQVIRVSSAATAEMIKIYENVFRNINIAFANEVAQLCDRMGLDVWEVIDGAATKPFGFMPFYPGPGLGGHCIPIDPYYLSWKARQHDFEVKFINVAADLNANMPYYVLSRVTRAFNEQGKSVKGSRILVLGAAYKPNVSDTRESPAYKLIPLLQKAGAKVTYHDPHVPELTVANGAPQRLRSVALSEQAVSGADCVLILTDHQCYDYQMILREARLIVDTRNALGLKNGHPDKVVRL